MEVTTDGIVLRRLPYTGASVILSVYTRKFGQVTFMARGMSRKGGAMSRAATVPLSRVEVVCSFRENRDMQTMRGLRLNPDAVFFDGQPQKAAVAMFLAEVLYKTLREEAPDEDLFDFIDEAVAYFAREPFTASFHLIFLMHLTRYFGFFPSGNQGPETPRFDLAEGLFTFHHATPDGKVLDAERSACLYSLSRTYFGEKPEGVNNLQRRRLLGDLLSYYALHLEGMGKINSLSVLSEVFS